MRISLNEIKKLVPAAAKVSTADLVQLIGSRLVEVEEAIDLAPMYENIYIAKVVECEPIEGTHLHLCQIDAGQESPIQVVCGAPNVHKGMLAVWLAPGAIVPQTYGEENFKLSVRKLQGHESHGMLAGLDELALGDDHSGIVEVDPSMDHPLEPRNVRPGDSFAEVFDLNDTILDIENKSLTHRPDCFGLVGFAREVAGVLGVHFGDSDMDGKLARFLASPTSELQQSRSEHGTEIPAQDRLTVADSEQGAQATTRKLTVHIADSELCPRYSCAVVSLKDPLAKDKYLTPGAVFLAKSGMRTISKIVDLTNILMLRTGQPLHAFDYDKFISVGGAKAPKIIVRAAKADEPLQLLDGKTIACTENDILITSNNVPVALAGAMGGASTEIDASTTRVLFESATFSLYHLRKTQMHHGIFSEAITRFTKGQPAGQTTRVLNATLSALQSDIDPAASVLASADAYPGKQSEIVINIAPQDINALLGTDYSTKDIVDTLSNVGMEVSISEEGGAHSGAPAHAAQAAGVGSTYARQDPRSLRVHIPYWRTDLHIKEDLIEEVGRLKGFDNIAKTLPRRPFIAAETDPLLAFKTSLRALLSDVLGANEILSYSFVSQKLQETVGEDPKDSYQLVNSLSPELQCVRQSLVPSLLEKTTLNLKAGHKHFTLYEMNQVSKKSDGLTDEKVPVVHHHLALVTTGDYYQAKAYLEQLLKKLGLRTPEFKPFKNGEPYFELLHSASVQPANISLGEIRSGILRKLKIDQLVSAFELDLEALLQATSTLATAHTPQISRYPSVDRDLTLKVPADATYQDIKSAIEKALASQENLVFSLRPASIYQKSEKTKNLSFSLSFASTKKTLDSAAISAIMEEVINAVQTLGAAVV